MNKFKIFIEKILIGYWYLPGYTRVFFWPVSILLSFIFKIRKLVLQTFFCTVANKSVVIVIGNITVGGTGKTPLVLYMANMLKKKGYTVAIATRGYKGKKIKEPLLLDKRQKSLISDEVELLLKLGVPVGVGANRVSVIRALEDKYAPDIILCDDGMQHYKMHRDIEVCVVDGDRVFGNTLLIPFGPLRELPSRLKSVDFIVSNNVRFANSYLMKCKPSRLYSLDTPDYDTLIYPLQRTKVHAVTGIGNANRFFDMLRGLGVKVIRHEYPDHYDFKQQDFNFNDGLPVIMTEKDAVKCKGLQIEDCYVLAIELDIDAKFEKDFIFKLEAVLDDKQKAIRDISMPNMQG